MRKEILISGLSGFVGSNLAKWLEPLGYQIIGVSREAKSTNEIKWNTFFELGSRAPIWIHLAGKAHDIHGRPGVNDYDNANYGLTKTLFDHFCKSEAKVFIFMSSVKAVADEVADVLFESNEPNPKTAYGISKLKAEKYILNNLPEGKKVYILRPCMIHGPGNKGNLNLLFRVVEIGLPWPLAAFENKRSFLSIQNLCLIIEKLAEGYVPSGIYQVADDEGLSTNELIMLMGEVLGRKVRLWQVSPSFIRVLARLGDVFNLPLNTSRLKKLTDSYVVDNNKIKTELELLLPMETKEGLTLTIKSFKK